MSIEAEQSILGGLMLLEFQGGQADKAINVLKANYFSHPLNRMIYQSAIALIEIGEAADIITIDGKLSNNQTYQDMDGFNYLANLAVNTPSASNVLAPSRFDIPCAIQPRWF